MQEIVDINRILKGEVCLQSFDAKTGKLRQEIKGKNHITRRGLLEMALKYLTGISSSGNAGSWATIYDDSTFRFTTINGIYSNLSLFNTTDKLPMGCGTYLSGVRAQLILASDSTPVESYDTNYSFTPIFSHSLNSYQQAGSNSWNPTNSQLTLAWVYGATDWSGTINSILIAHTATSPADCAHRVVLASPFTKTTSDNVVLTWTWTIILPS